MSEEHYPGEADESAAAEASCTEPMTPHALTREQVVFKSVPLDPVEQGRSGIFFNNTCIGVHPRDIAEIIVSQLSMYDASLRQALAQQEQEVERLKVDVVKRDCVLTLLHFIVEHDGDFDNPETVEAEAIGNGLENVLKLKHQLAAMTVERDEADARRRETVAMCTQLQASLTESEQAAYDVAGTIDHLKATLAEREATINELINRDARQQEREKNWRECFEEFKDLANGVERKYLQSHAVAIKNGLDTARQDAARLREALTGALHLSDYEERKAYIQRALKGEVPLTASRPDCATAEQVEQYIKMANDELGPDSSLPWVEDIRQFLRTRYTTR